MLSVKNLVKVYKTKGGVSVRALDGVSVDFPETGMVFLLGKSGSGKSTLLNMAGGLDVPDSGEIIVKGRSSKDFSAVDFDSYRNTFIGFIFQEYNILNEFNVEQNIALALQLQGKPNDKKAVNALLEKVDLVGLNKRKPNTLSGGQKQRIAIARALIKEPEIIMADEPTGALDSKTGEQVFDTLKKLSETKLILIVSHDRDFAEKYGDRIIELKDGKILSDNSKVYLSPKSISENVNFIGEDTVRIKNAGELSEAELKTIVKKMQEKGGESIITFGESDVKNIKTVCRIGDDDKKESFSDTDIEAVAQNKKAFDGSKTKFIKSKLPGSHAVKIGLSGLKIKPIRLLFTILLSVVAFTLFGVVATMMMFDPAYSIGVALESSAYDNVMLDKKYSYTNETYEVKDGVEKFSYSYDQTVFTRFNQEEIDNLNKNSENLKFAGVTNFSTSEYAGSDNTFKLNSSLAGELDNAYYQTKIIGFTDCGKSFIEGQGFNIVAGKYPTEANEIMISEYTFDSIKNYSFKKTTITGGSVSTDGTATKITNYNDILNEYLLVGNNNVPLKIVGIVNTGAVNQKYETLKTKLDATSASKNEQDERAALELEFEDYIMHSFRSVFFVSDNFFAANKNLFGSDSGSGGNYISSISVQNASIYTEKDKDLTSGSGSMYAYVFTESTVKNYSDAFTFYKFNSDHTAVTAVEASSFTVDTYGLYCSGQSLIMNVISKIRYATRQTTGDIEENFETYYSTASHDKYDKFVEACSKTENYHNKDSEDFQKPFSTETITAILTALNDLPDDFKTYNDKGEQIEAKSYIIDYLTKAYAENSNNVQKDLTIEGFYFINEGYDPYTQSLIVSTALVKEIEVKDYESNSFIYKKITNYVLPDDANYNYIVAVTGNGVSIAQTKFMMNAGNSEQRVTYSMQNNVYISAQMMISLIDSLRQAFLIIACVLGVFSALMLFNFISLSISTKKREIGILRAVGARGADVFRIFFSEGGFIAFICFVISVIASYFVCNIINTQAMGMDMIKMSLLDFGIIEVGLILGISLIVSFIATLIPVFFAAKKPPVESIRAL